MACMSRVSAQIVSKGGVTVCEDVAARSAWLVSVFLCCAAASGLCVSSNTQPALIDKAALLG